MPVYEYACARCERVTEALRKMADADEPLACEFCGSQETSRKHSVFITSQGESSSAPTPASTRGCGPGCGCHP
jgi:putative FmdB family regulatory protein